MSKGKLAALIDSLSDEQREFILNHLIKFYYTEGRN